MICKYYGREEALNAGEALYNLGFGLELCVLYGGTDGLVILLVVSLSSTAIERFRWRQRLSA